MNSLNSVVAEKGDPGKVESLVLSLAGYLRFSLQQGPGLAPLGRELDALENYLQVEKIRFEEKLEYQVVAAAAARAHQVPNALVLPLLENAVKYGQLTSGWPLRLGISARLEAGEMVIGVANSGRWMEPGVSGGSGIGLANLRRRLELLYGGRARLEVVEGDCQVEVQVRCQRHPQRAALDPAQAPGLPPGQRPRLLLQQHPGGIHQHPPDRPQRLEHPLEDRHPRLLAAQRRTGGPQPLRRQREGHQAFPAHLFELGELMEM